MVNLVMKTFVRQTTILVLLSIAPSLPAQTAAPPLPPVETVLKRVTERSKQENDNDRAFNQQFTYTQTKVTEYLNAGGEVKKREEKQSVHTPAVVTVAANRPQPAAPKPLIKNAEDNAPVSDTHSNVRGKAFEKKDFLLNDDLLSRFQFTLAGRELLNGRSALIVDFKPLNKKLPERNLKDRFINKAAGRVWVDEADYVLAKADLHLSDKVNVLGGLVGSVWGFKYGFERERTADGLWFTRNVNWHLEGREVFFRRTIDYHEQKTDLKKAA
jgi:hypothetical protein